MKPTIIATSYTQLLKLIEEEIKLNGIQCDLNHIDVSNMVDLSHLFSYSRFNGDISKWNVSNVKFMSKLFFNSNFNGDISDWDVSKVTNMYAMFEGSKFNGDLSNWKPYNEIESENIFLNCPANIPYWEKCKSKEERKNAIDSYHLKSDLEQELSSNNTQEKRIKI